MTRFPYGIADFRRIRREGMVYVDRTGHIGDLESLGSILVFLRPRRFGKSLWIQTLATYYDLRYAPADRPPALSPHRRIRQLRQRDDQRHPNLQGALRGRRPFQGADEGPNRPSSSPTRTSAPTRQSSPSAPARPPARV